jgi:hypothetical protein
MGDLSGELCIYGVDSFDPNWENGTHETENVNRRDRSGHPPTIQPEQLLMNTQRVVGILSAAIILLLSAAPGQAQFVTYQVSGTISEADNTALMPSALSSALAGGTLVVDFTVNTATAALVNAPGDNFYMNPIVSVSASVGSGFAAIGNDISQVEISADYLASGTSSYQTQFNAFATSNTPSTGIASGFGLVTATSAPQPQSIYPNASLSNAPLSASLATDTDSLVLGFVSYSDGDFQSVGDISVFSDVAVQQVGSVSAPEIDPTSAVSALTLLLGSLAVLRGRKVRGELLARR